MTSGWNIGARGFQQLASRRDQEVRRYACWQSAIEILGFASLLASAFTGILSGAATVIPLLLAALLVAVMRPISLRRQPRHDLLWRRFFACLLTLLGVELFVVGLGAPWMLMAMVAAVTVTAWSLNAHGERYARRDAARDRWLASSLGAQRIPIIPM